MKLRRIAALILFLFLFPDPALSQSSEKAAPPLKPRSGEAMEISGGLEKKAIARLQELIEEGARTQGAENQIQILCFAAETVWKHDEERAGAYQAEAIRLYLGMNARPAGESMEARQRIRTRLIESISPYDPLRAYELLRSTRANAALANGAAEFAERELQMEIKLATQVAEKEPRLAMQLAREILKQDSDFQLADIWRQLDRKDPAMAAQLAGEVAAKFRTANLMKNIDAASLLTEMVFDLRGKLRAGPKTQNAADLAAQQAREPVFRELLNLLLSATLKLSASDLVDLNEQGQARNLLMQAQSLLPEVEKYLPARLAPLRAKLAQLDNAYFHPPAPIDPELDSKSAGELLALARKSAGEIKDHLADRALARSMEEGDLALAKQIAAEHPHLASDQMAEEIERRENEKNVAEGKIGEARERVRALPSVAERALALVSLSDQIKEARAKRALLEEALALLGDRMDTQGFLEAQVATACALATLDEDRAFARIEAAIDRLNAINSAALLLTNFSRKSETEPEELRIASRAMRRLFTGGLEGKLLLLSRANFDRAIESLARCEPAPLRMTLQLALIGAALNPDRSDSQMQSLLGSQNY